MKCALLVLATMCALHMGGADAAVDDCRNHYDKPLPHSSRVASAAIEAADIELSKRNFDAARKLLDAALEKSSGHDDAAFWLNDAYAATYAAEGRIADALQVLQRSIALDLNVRGRYEVRRKLAITQGASGQHAAAIATLEAMQREICSPLAGRLARQLVESYLHEQKFAEAEKALEPLRADPGEIGTSDVLHLDFMLQCASGKARACVDRFMRLQTRKELDEPETRLFNLVLPAIRKSTLADDLLAEARQKDWIDASGQAVVSTDASSRDELKPLSRKAPRYPRDAIRQKVEGWVELALTIAPDGSVRTASVIDSRPPGVFEDAALKAIRDWTFEPKRVDGNPVEMTGRQRLEFKMKK